METSTDRLAATLGLADSVSRVRLVSAARVDALADMGIRTVRDLLASYPRRYLDLTRVDTVLSSKLGQPCTIVGQVHEIKLKRPKPRLPLVEMTLCDATGTLIVTAFKQPWLMDKVRAGMRVAVAGAPEFSFGFKRMTNPFIEVLDSAGGDYHGRMIPVHPACEKITPAQMRTIMANALAQYGAVYDPLPPELRVRYRLMSRAQALQCIHFPTSAAEAQAAKRRIIYDELLTLELLLLHERHAQDAAFEPRVHCTTGAQVENLRLTCPFTPTEDQSRAVGDILARMSAPRRMNHLLLGDVGTGKTLVAAFALAAAADTGTQAVLMAPTELLAQQHARTLAKLFEPLGVRHALLTGGTPVAARADMLAQLVAGELDVLIGTHAVLEPDVCFRDCSLVVIDEQQRFGVDQRATLLTKAPGADALFLTATPIPRTLALSLYGDLSLSYLKERPVAGAGRRTHVVTWQSKGDAYAGALAALERGEQVYVVCPLVDGAVPAKARGAAGGEDGEGGGGEGRGCGARGAAVGTGTPTAPKAKDNSLANPKPVSFNADTPETYAYASVTIEADDDFPDPGPTAAVERARILSETVFANYEVGLLHGKLPAAEKERVMRAFADGHINVLVATTVIEVGIDVPNATVMIIDSADRFGLSQLHQLRGRVGRGEKSGDVYLISSSTSKVAMERLAAMKTVDDGFELATYDLSLRREGDVLGNRQHGASVLKLVNVVRDAAVVEAAHADAQAIIDEDPNLTAPKHRALARELRETFAGISAKIGG